MKIFISYAHEDYERIRQYVSRLQAEPNIDLFWDKNISPGEDFLSILAQQATGTDILIVFVSVNSYTSRFVRREVLLVDSKDRIQIIPIYLDDPVSMSSRDTGLLFVLQERQAILAYESDFESSCQKLIETIRLTASPTATSIPIISVMGTKGGVGKSTIIAAMAELIASAGQDVMIIDADIQTAGVGKYISGRAHSRPHIWSVLDIVYARLPGAIPNETADKGAWNVTPKYLADKRFGNIYLIPARLETDSRPRYESIADFGPAERNQAALAIMDEIIARTQDFPAGIDCILIDSGAENNPLVSAAMVRATYGFLVSAPNLS